MKTVLSASARAYLRQEAAYLQVHSRKAAQDFLERMKTALKDIGRYPDVGAEIEDLPMPDMRRLLRGGYRIDYKVAGELILVAAISSSVNVPQTNPDDHDDFDYEAD